MLLSSYVDVSEYSHVSNRQGVWNSRSGRKKYQKLIVGGGGEVLIKIRPELKVLIAEGRGLWLLN